MEVDGVVIGRVLMLRLRSLIFRRWWSWLSGGGQVLVVRKLSSSELGRMIGYGRKTEGRWFVVLSLIQQYVIDDSELEGMGMVELELQRRFV